MVTFLNILFALILINAILLVFSVNRAKKKTEKPAPKIKVSAPPKVFPMDLTPAEYKEAI